MRKSRKIIEGKVGQKWGEFASLSFFQIGSILSSFFLFVFFFYKQMFGDIERGNLVNPLKVFAQLCSFLFNFYFPLKPDRRRRRLLLCFFLCLETSLYLQGIDLEKIFIVLVLFLISFIIFPLDSVYLIIFWGYFLDQGLAKWGFYLAFQQVSYYALSFILEKASATPKRILSFIFLLLIQVIFGFIYYEENFISYPLLSVLFSGACIIFLSLKERAGRALIIPFFFYFIKSIFVGIVSSPSDKTTIWGIQNGIFLFLHIWLLLGFICFKESLPGRKQPLVPFFFSCLFLLLGHFPELSWLEKWIKGIDLLLLGLGLFVLFFE